MEHFDEQTAADVERERIIEHLRAEAERSSVDVEWIVRRLIGQLQRGEHRR